MTIEITVNFTPPDGDGDAKVEYLENGEKWNPAAVAYEQSQSYTFTQGNTDGWLLWGISVWGVGPNPGGRTRARRSHVARLVTSQGDPESACFKVGESEPYAYVTGITKSCAYTGGQEIWSMHFTVNNNNPATPQGQSGLVCFQVVFTNSSWDRFYVSRDPEIPLQKEPVGSSVLSDKSVGISRLPFTKA